MPTNIGGSDTFPAQYQIPSDGDVKPVSSVNAALEALANRTKWAWNRLLGNSGGVVLLAPQLDDPQLTGTTTVADMDVSGLHRNLGVLANSGTGRIRKRYVALPDADATIHIGLGDLFELPFIAGGVDRTISVSSGGSPAAGDMIEIYSVNTSANKHIVLAAGGGSFDMRFAATFTINVKLVWNGTFWATVVYTKYS